MADLIANQTLFVGDGYRAKNNELAPHGIPFARGANINDGFKFEDADRFPVEDLSKVGNKVSQPGDVVFTAKGTVGRLAWVRPDTPRFVYSPQLCFWRSLKPDQIDPRFLYYWMNGREFFLQYSGVKGQTDMADYVSLGDQRTMHITMPLLEEQRRIANILGSLDDKIALNRRLNATLEALARALFQSWFVDFDPVRAKAAGRQPAGMDAETATLFPEGFEDSEIGEIPAGWQVTTLAEVSDINKRSMASGYPYKQIEYVDISSVTEGQLEGTASYECSQAPSRAKRLVQHGDTIWSTVRPNRKSFLYIHHPAPNLVVSTGFAVLSPHSVPPSYLYVWVTTDEFVDYLVSNADGSAYPAVLPGRFGAASLLLPPNSVLDAFHAIVGPMHDRIAHNGHENVTLAAMRDALLPRLMSGELKPESQILG